jgi:hypothetical protein
LQRYFVQTLFLQFSPLTHGGSLSGSLGPFLTRGFFFLMHMSMCRKKSIFFGRNTSHDFTREDENQTRHFC